MEVEHAFFKSGATPFDLSKINSQIGNIMTNKNFDIVKRGKLDWPKNKEGKTVFGGKPIWIDDDGSLDANDINKEMFPFEMIERPLDGIKNAHVAAVDPYHIDDELEEMKKGGKADNKSKGFEMMNLDMPKKNNLPEKKINKLKNIWHGKDINKVREAHIKNKADTISICKTCPFKETYKWKKII